MGIPVHVRAAAELELRRRKIEQEVKRIAPVIAPETTFLEWCEDLAKNGLKVDEHPFSLEDRPAMRWIYSIMPSTPEEAFRKMIVLMKCAQVGFTIEEILFGIYCALKWSPCKIGMYLPARPLAAIKSTNRFMPIVRTIPMAYSKLTEDSPGTGEGNVLIREMGSSRFHFLWTSGKAMTESVPLDVLTFDEVQEMTIADMEKTRERLSGSKVRFTLMGSTAKWPDQDIHYWYKRGTQHQFHTWCQGCGDESVLDEKFPDCIQFNHDEREYGYKCLKCGDWISDPQQHNPAREHGWVAKHPDAETLSIHFPQFLSPSISPREIIEAYFNADDMMNFYNRKLGKPFLDPSKIPISMEMLNQCAKEGARRGVVWKMTAKGAFMAIDQMGKYNVVLVAERLSTGHMAIIYAEEIYDEDPFARCDEFIKMFGVSVCVLESLPNYNDAHRFAKRHEGTVFLVNKYTAPSDNWLLWGDAVPTRAERKTDEEDYLRYTVTLNQYRAMDMAFEKIKKGICLFPDAQSLKQEVKEKGVRKTVCVFKDRVFFHLTRTALIAEQDPEEKKMRTRVVKVGIDPHYAYAFMMLNVAWARAHGATSFIIPDAKEMSEREGMPGLPEQIVAAIESSRNDTCGQCISFDEGLCLERNVKVAETDPGCSLFIEQ